VSSKWLVCLYRHTTTPPHQARTRACLTKACLTKARLTTLLPYYRTAQGLDLGQLGDDDTRKLSIASMLGLSAGFSGWTARVVAAGEAQKGYTIAKRDA